MSPTQKLRDAFCFPVMALLLLAVAAGYFFFFFSKAQAYLDITVEQKGLFKLYWAAEGEPFREENSAKVKVSPANSHYRFYLEDLSDLTRLRVDTHDYHGRAILKTLTVRQRGFEDLVIDNETGYDELVPLAQIADTGIDQDGLLVVANGTDPNFLYILKKQRVPVSWIEETLRILIFFGIASVIYATVSFLSDDYLFVPVCLALVVILVLTMALISKDNSHPDEYVHVAAVEYYKNAWLPPKIESGEIGNTYSIYGVSRLNSDEIYYLVAGKFAWLAEPLFLSKTKGGRMFSVLLLVSILLTTILNVKARLAALPLLVSPQIWYVFSYCNSDSFALAATFYAGWQVACQNSVFNRYLRGELQRGKVFYMFLCGIVIGLLFLLKHNYLPFTLLFFTVVILRYFVSRDVYDRKGVFLRFAVLLCIGLSLFAGKRIADYSVNGYERGELIQMAKEDHSIRQYSGGASLDDQPFTLHMKERGVSAEEMLHTYHWHDLTFYSTFGVYGYLDLYSSPFYYRAVKVSVAILLGLLLVAIAVNGSMESRLITGSALLLSIALVGASFHHSWVADFQPQGRYLFPVFAMLGIVFTTAHGTLSTIRTGFFTLWLFILSIYSFITVGLLYIPRGICV